LYTTQQQSPYSFSNTPFLRTSRYIVLPVGVIGEAVANIGSGINSAGIGIFIAAAGVFLLSNPSMFKKRKLK